MKWKNILKHPVVLKNIRNFHPGKDYLIGFVSIGFVSLPWLETLEKKEKFQKVISERDNRLYNYSLWLLQCCQNVVAESWIEFQGNQSWWRKWERSIHGEISTFKNITSDILQWRKYRWVYRSCRSRSWRFQMSKLSVTLKDDNGRDCVIENIRTFQKPVSYTHLTLPTKRIV